MSAAELEIGAARRAKSPQAGPIRIALFGGFGIGNFGNDASLEATAEYLRAEHPGVALSAICTAPDVIAQRFGLRSYPASKRPSGALRLADLALLRAPRAVMNWIYTLGLLKRFDMVLVAGTGVFDDYRDSP